VQNLFFVTQSLLNRKISRFSAFFVLAAMLGALTGCGSGQAIPQVFPTTSTAGSGTAGSVGAGTLGGTTTTGASQTIAGTVATGAPVAGAKVTVQDHNGKTNSGTTAANGTFAISVTGGTPPFILAAIPASGSNMYSILPSMDMTVTGTQNVNITPITTLVMYELNGGADPASMYTGFVGTSPAELSAGAVASKETTVRSRLPANSMNPIFSTLYGAFTAAVGGTDPYDNALDALGSITSMTAAAVTLTNAGGVVTTYSSGAGSGAAAGAASVALTLTDPATGAVRNSISTSSPAQVTATVRNANGAAVANAIVTFTTDANFGTFSGGANTALTNSNGIATVTLTTSNTTGGAAAVNADTKVAGVGVTGSLNYSVGASTLTLSAITLPASLSAYGTASVSVTVLNNGVLYTTPISVQFTSACAANGKASLTSSVTTVNGVAAASYLDNGCNNASPGDTVTATLATGVTQSASLKVSAPALGSIQYVSTVTTPATTPPVITLKGTGGASRSETARVTFKVVDSAGNPVGNTLVNFSLNTSLGGLSLSSASATSDPTTGYVVTNVIAGTISTAVRVTASTGTLSTQSDQLVVSTGIPAQDSFSLSASGHNIEGWAYDGVTSTLTARLADHFHNPVPDGTAISFTSEGGSIVASCNTVGGVCTSVLSSQALRPSNGRVTVLARATGEEAFTDKNGNGTADNATEMVDANSASTDMPEAFVDYNENGIRDAGEPYFDFNGNGAYDAADGLYNGVLCTSGAAVCAAQKSIDVRASQIIVFSSSSPNITISNAAGTTVYTSSTPIPVTTCVPGSGNAPFTFKVTVVDVNGNAMPAGTSIAFTTTNGLISSSTVNPYVVPDTIGCRTSDPAGNTYSCPASAASATFMDIPVTMTSDRTYTNGVCGSADTPSGTFSVKVTTPKGLITTGTATITD
jgi:hypothetical protein